ncbi:1,2-phenylacetyl-CoA epoxidase subunit PaaD [Jatrophihabitans sp. DSM 45814]
MTTPLERAWTAVGAVADPEMPMLSLVDLGIVREVGLVDETLVVSITPTYSGCPAMSTIRVDLQRALSDAGFARAEVRTVLRPAWSSEWITPAGRQKLRENGIAPPEVTDRITADVPRGRIPLTLVRRAQAVHCPQCGSTDTRLTSEFGSTACKSMHRCRSCAEPFDHVKEI